MANVGIVIVSHSPKVAEGAAEMVRQMVGDDVPLAWTGGDSGGGLGTSFEAITEAMPLPYQQPDRLVIGEHAGCRARTGIAALG